MSSKGSNEGSKPAEGEMTIRQLAERTGMTVRNIRAHQTRGLLPPPTVRGRTGYYGEEHVARIELTREMQADGLNLEAIRRVLDGGDGSAAAIFDFTRALRTPFEDEVPEIVEAEELAGIWGEVADPKLTRRAEKLGILRSLPDGRVEVISPRLLAAAAELAELGVGAEGLWSPPRNFVAMPTGSPARSSASSSRRSGSRSTAPAAPRGSGRG